MNNKNTAVFSIIFLCASMYLLHISSSPYSESHLSNWLRTAPIYFVSKAQQSLNKQQPKEGVENIKNAIISMKSIERYSADEVKTYIDKSIFELNFISDQILHNKIDKSELNHAFYRAINTVAYAELRISKNEFAQGEVYQSLALMKTVQILLQRSLVYSDSSDTLKEEELIIIEHVKILISEIEESGVLSEKEFILINTEIEELLNKMLKTDYENI